MNQSREETLRMPINERRWMIDRFIQQKTRENESMEAARNKAKR